MINLNEPLILSAVLLALGAIGVIVRRNLIIVLMSIELMLNAANLAFISFSKSLGDVQGHVFVLMAFAVAAAEAAVGLAILVAIYRKKRSVDSDALNSLKW
jgi:NADH-quinone oxidoreductase subunit K